MLLRNAHADVSGEAIDLTFCLGPHLHPYVLYAGREGAGESVQTRLRAVTAQ